MTINAPLNRIPEQIFCAQDYEQLAPEFIPADRLAYIAGGSGRDKTLTRNSAAFDHYALLPKTFKSETTGNTTITLPGASLTHPVMLAPVALQTLVHPLAELATAQAAAATESCMVASTLSSVTMEQIADRAPDNRWFQLYFQTRDEDTQDLIDRAVAAGYKALVITVDAAIQLPSNAALKAGFELPNSIFPANIFKQPPAPEPAQHSNSRIFSSYMALAPTRDKLARLIRQSPVPVYIKGVLDKEEALLMKNLGAAGIIVSNHGGRTLDDVPASLEMLPQIRQAVGTDYPLLLDSGLRSGSDIFKALALGADAVLIGRLQVYALSVAGALGVAHMLKLLKEELEHCMAMTGCSSLADIKHYQLHQNRN